MLTNDQIIQIISSEIAPALGCTEPISAVLAVVKARETLNGRVPDKIVLYVSGNMYKNGKSVGIPNTDMRGLKVAAALGMVTGDSKNKLEVLKDVNDEHIVFARKALEEGRIELLIKENVDKLYVEAVANVGNDTAVVVIEKRHTNICSVSLNDKVIETNEYKEVVETRQDGSYEGLTVQSIYECAKNVELEKISFIMEAARLNKIVSDEGLRGDYGLKVGKRLLQNAEKGLLKDDLMITTMARAAAGSDARMAGCGLPVITNSGSGNQGITITLPVLEVAERQGADEETLIRALFLAHAIPVHIKKRIGPLSALCGVVSASIGAGAGMLYLMNGTLKQIENMIQYMLADLSGMICDGAKPSCALKISTCIGTAVQSVLFSLDDSVTPFDDGIVNKDVEESIKNYADLGVSGMARVDDVLLQSMSSEICD